MRIRLIFVGKTREEYLRTGITEYLDRISRFHSVEQVVINSPAATSAPNLQTGMEAKLILRKLETKDFVILLDEHGKQVDSPGFARLLQPMVQQHARNLALVIGGPYGVDQSIRERANQIIALSRMTFTHQMARLILAEQLYRAMDILRGGQYHHE